MPFEIEEAGLSNNRIKWLNVVVIPGINGKIIALKGIHKMFL
jgi:hypothetical protein